MAKVVTKRKPTPPNGGGNKKSKTGLSQSVQNKDENRTVFNSALDNKLATKDAYEGTLDTTVNSMYKFTTTMSLSKITDILKGGVNGLNKLSSYLKEANAIKDAFKNGNIMDAVGRIAPGAKAALAAAGMDEKLFDKFQKAAEIGVNVAGTFKKVKNGDINLLEGLNDLARSIVGEDIAIIKDLMAFEATVSTIIKEFSDAGIAIKDEWNKLIGRGGKADTNTSTNVAMAVMPYLAVNGDYQTMLSAIRASDPQRLDKLGPEIISKMIKEFSLNAVFNRGRKEEEIYADLFAVLRAFQGGSILWVDSGNGRKLFNLHLFMGASEDFKKMVRVTLKNRFFKPEGESNQFDYNDEKNEVLILLVDVFKFAGSFSDELNKDFPNFITNTRALVNPVVTPTEFRPRVY